VDVTDLVQRAIDEARPLDVGLILYR